MTDKEFKELLLKVQAELIERYGSKVCKEIAVGCKNCEIQILLGYIASEIDLSKCLTYLENN